LNKIVLYIKTYKPDYERAEKLLRSVEKFNKDNIPVYVSVNDMDYDFFRKRISGNLALIKDSEIVTCNITHGWVYQQIVKSQFYKLGVCENYLCIDSDSEFIRDFYISDFMYDENTPYTIMHEGKSFLDTMEIIGHDSKDLFYVKALKSVRDQFGTHGKLWDYGPSPYLWSTKVWKHFHEHYLVPKGLTFESFLGELEKTALPSETVVYGEYLRMTKVIDIWPIEGFFKVYHYKEQFQLEGAHFDIDRLKKTYMGIIKQSNWNYVRKKRWYTFFR
jgi:hypothetical protein